MVPWDLLSSLLTPKHPDGQPKGKVVVSSFYVKDVTDRKCRNRDFQLLPSRKRATETECFSKITTHIFCSSHPPLNCFLENTFRDSLIIPKYVILLSLCVCNCKLVLIYLITSLHCRQKLHEAWLLREQKAQEEFRRKREKEEAARKRQEEQEVWY